MEDSEGGARRPVRQPVEAKADDFKARAVRIPQTAAFHKE